MPSPIRPTRIGRRMQSSFIPGASVLSHADVLSTAHFDWVGRLPVAMYRELPAPCRLRLLAIALVPESSGSWQLPVHPEDSRGLGLFFNPHSAIKSFVPERDHRVYLRRTPRRDITGQERHSDQERGHARECQRVCGAHTKQQLRHQACQPERGDESDARAGEREHHSLPDEQTEYVTRESAERQANANLVRPLADRPGDDSAD